MSDLAIRRRPAGRALIYAVLGVFVAFYLAPLIVVALNSVRSVAEISRTSVLGLPQALHWENWAIAWGRYCMASVCEGVRPYMWNSAVMTVPATLLSTLLGAISGYALSLWRFPGANWFFGVITLGVFLPVHMKLVPWALSLRALGLSESIGGLILIHVVQGLSFTILFCRNYYLTIPEDLIKAARVDGAGFFRIFWRIVLPLSPPILIVCVIWQFTGIWNEYLFGSTFSSRDTKPVTAALISFSATIAQAREYGVEAAAVLIAAMPTLLIYVVGGKFFVRGLTAGAVK
ncbi:MAG: carbohydrate ABC transporter permease [Ramlibacter sp.]